MIERRGRVICEKAAMYATNHDAVSEPRMTSMPPKISTTDIAVIPRNSLMGDASCCLRAIERSRSDMRALTTLNLRRT